MEGRADPAPAPPKDPPKAKPKKAVVLAVGGDRVWAYHKTFHPRAQLDDKLTRLINKALTGFTPEDLCHAIQGCHDDAWHAEKGKTNLGYILRDHDKISEFIGKYDATNRVICDEPGKLNEAGQRYFLAAGIKVA